MNVSHYTPVIVTREGFPVVGLKAVTTVQASIEHGAIKRLEAAFFKRSIEIKNRVGRSKILVQIYPPSGHMGYHTSYTVLLGYPPFLKDVISLLFDSSTPSSRLLSKSSILLIPLS